MIKERSIYRQSPCGKDYDGTVNQDNDQEHTTWECGCKEVFSLIGTQTFCCIDNKWDWGI